MRGGKDTQKKRHAPHSASFVFFLRVPPARVPSLRPVCPAPRFPPLRSLPAVPLDFLLPALPVFRSANLHSCSSSLLPFVPSARLLGSRRRAFCPPVRVIGLPSVRTSRFLPARPCRQPLPGPLRPCGKRENEGGGPEDPPPYPVFAAACGPLFDPEREFTGLGRGCRRGRRSSASPPCRWPFPCRCP